MTALNVDRLREVLDYDPGTGLFRWKARLARKLKIGDLAGSANGARRYIRIDNRTYFAHRLAWMYVHGTMPEGVIDHLNGDASDNRIANLRDTTQRANMENQRAATSQSKTGVLGVGRRGHRYSSRIMVAGKEKWLGYHDTVEAAHAAYLRAKRALHSGCTI